MGILKGIPRRAAPSIYSPHGGFEFTFLHYAPTGKLWYDAEADFLEVRFSDAAGYEKATRHDAVMQRVDTRGKVIGFSVMGVSRFKKAKPLKADLAAA